MKSQSYNIVLNSTNGIGTLNASKTYYFDFNQIKGDTSYELTFSHVGMSNAMTTFNLPLVYVDIGQSNSYEANTINTGNISKCIGVLHPNTIATNSFLHADLKNSNPPVYLDKLHSFSSISVNIVNQNGVLWTDSSGNDIAPYVMILHLNPVH